MVLVIELPEGDASLVLRLADQLPEGETPERCAQPLVSGLLRRDAEMPVPCLDHGAHGVLLRFLACALAAGIALAGFAFASTDRHGQISFAVLDVP